MKSVYKKKQFSYFIISVLVLGLMQSLLHARHFYTPDTSNYQLQHLLIPVESKKITSHITTSGYIREAHQTYITHGTSVEPLSALYFGKSEFRLSQIFQNCYVAQNTQYYSPFMRVLKLRPRINFSETGLNINFCSQLGLQNNKTRIGFRLGMPIKRQRIERKDMTWRDTAQLQDLVAEQTVPVDGGSVSAFAYRLDFIEALRTTGTQTTPIDYSFLTQNGDLSVKIFNSEVSVNTEQKIGAALVVSPEGHVPAADRLSVTHTAKGETNSQINEYLPTTLDNLKNDTFYEFQKDQDAYASLADNADKTTAQRIIDQDKKAQLWVISTLDGASLSNSSKAIQAGTQDSLGSFRANTYEWLHDRGFLLESDEAVGLGDLSLEVFIQHNIRDDIIGEIAGGLIAPTGVSHESSDNPYHVRLGNGGHTECFLRAKISAPLIKKVKILHVTADITGGYALPGIEYRSATPLGSQVKNIGKEMRSTVDWATLDGNVAIHLKHPNAPILLTSGYNLYYKTKDSLTFETNQTESWLGKFYVNNSYSGENVITLDNQVAQMNSEIISHKIHAHVAYELSPDFCISFGGSYIVAGKNCPQETELSAGCTVTF